MSEFSGNAPIRILPFGGCQLSAALTPLIDSGRALCTTNDAGLNMSTYTMAEILQRVRFARGEIEIPTELRYFCNLPVDAQSGSKMLARLEQADLVLLEPNTTLDVFFGPYALHRSTLLTGFIDVLQNSSAELRAASDAWWNVGIFGKNRVVQKEAASVLIPALKGKVENESIARKLLLEARGIEQSPERFRSDLEEFCDLIRVPIGLITFVFMFMPNARPLAWPAHFIETAVEAATSVNLPIFDSAAMVKRHGVEVALDSDRKLYRKEFLPAVADELYRFALEVLERGRFESAEIILKGPYEHTGGNMFKVYLSDVRFGSELVRMGDSMQTPTRSKAYLFQDGNLLGPAHVRHAEIEELGSGRFSHWGDTIYFSSSDNSDPNANGRKYSIRFSATMDGQVA